MMDLVLEAWVAAQIERARLAWMLGGGIGWQPGERLKLLFAGYNGTRNTGSDVRVEEMLRQVRRVLGAQNVALTVMTQNFERTRGYFGDAAQVHLPNIFPPFLYREVRRHHGVVACEGSMFKSKFANALTTMMIGSLGIAAVENKVSIGYGAEAGEMDRSLQRLCARYCGQSLILTRNEASQAMLSSLGVPSELGADTAWTFEPHGAEFGRRALSEAGWDGRAPVLVVCPIHPFCWPVRARWRNSWPTRRWAPTRSSHYRSVYFHTAGPEVDAAFERYLSAIAGAVDGVPPAARRLRHSGGHGTARCARLRGSGAAHRRRARLRIRSLRHVRAGERAARLRLDGFLALPRHRHFHAGPGAVGGHHHGRTHPQPDAGARA